MAEPFPTYANVKAAPLMLSMRPANDSVVWRSWRASLHAPVCPSGSPAPVAGRSVHADRVTVVGVLGPVRLSAGRKPPQEPTRQLGRQRGDHHHRPPTGAAGDQLESRTIAARFRKPSHPWSWCTAYWIPPRCSKSCDTKSLIAGSIC